MPPWVPLGRLAPAGSSLVRPQVGPEGHAAPQASSTASPTSEGSKAQRAVFASLPLGWAPAMAALVDMGGKPGPGLTRSALQPRFQTPGAVAPSALPSGAALRVHLQGRAAEGPGQSRVWGIPWGRTLALGELCVALLPQAPPSRSPCPFGHAGLAALPSSALGGGAGGRGCGEEEDSRSLKGALNP